MSCISELLKLKGDKEFLPINDHAVIEGGGVYLGYEYLITFTQFGTRCGYVALPDNHHGDNAELVCHGGITFNSQFHDAKQLLSTNHCDDLWLGFDANHFDDSPDLDLALKYMPDSGFVKCLIEHREHKLKADTATHKSYKYMVKECEHLIEQLFGIEHD